MNSESVADVPVVEKSRGAAPLTSGSMMPSPLEQMRAKHKQQGTPTKPAHHRSHLIRSILHLTRRGHLYAGLLLVPWVFLYGMTGFLFNHPEVWPDRVTYVVTRSLIRGTPLADLPPASAVAAEVVAAINSQGETQYLLLEPEKVEFARNGLGGTLKGEKGQSYNVTLGTTGTGFIREVRTTPGAGSSVEAEGGGREGGGRKDSKEAAPFAVKEGLMLKNPLAGKIEAGLKEVLSRLKLTGLEIAQIRVTPLSFRIKSGEQTWQVSYNPVNGSLSGKPAIQEPASLAMSMRLFLLRLHMAHGYPNDDSWMRYVWAIIVDIMAFVMVFWGISGIVMWWQIKRTRWLGGLCLLVSLSMAAYVGIGMHELISAAGR